MLFWAPNAHYNDLRRVWVDECINAPRWKDFSRNLMAEWTGITIYVCVIVVNISFQNLMPVCSLPVHRDVGRRCEFPCSTKCEHQHFAVGRNYCYIHLNYLHHWVLNHLTPAGTSDPKIWSRISGGSGKSFSLVCISAMLTHYIRQSSWKTWWGDFSGWKPLPRFTVSLMPCLCGGRSTDTL